MKRVARFRKTSIGDCSSPEFASAFHGVFTGILPEAHRILRRYLADDPQVRSLLSRFVANSYPSEYPFIFSMCLKLGEGSQLRGRSLAAAIHLLQSSTFIVDDIFDGSSLRYDHTPVHRTIGANAAFSLGVILQSISLVHITSTLNRSRSRFAALALEELTAIPLRVYSGQFFDITRSGELHVSRRSYMKMISLTTASFLSSVAAAGGLLAGLSGRAVNWLRQYGHHYGVALQVVDDVIDLTDHPAQTGKAFALDLLCRRPRLPMIIALDRGLPAQRRELEGFIRSGADAGRDELTRIIAIIRETGALKRCRSIVAAHVAMAVSRLRSFADSASRRMLEHLAYARLEDLEAHHEKHSR